jgi:hypothetical protein
VTQRAYSETVRGDLGLETLRQHHLVDVARGDVLLGDAHLLFEPFPVWFE